MSILRIAPIGAGIMGRQHLAYLRQLSDAALCAIVDPTEQARQLAAEQGVPWFAEQNSGLGFVTLGYVIGFVLAAALVGWLARRGADRTFRGTIAAMVAGNLVIYAVGVPVLAQRAGLALSEAAVGNLVFVPFDLVKVVMAAIVAAAVHRAFPDLLDRDRR